MSIEETYARVERGLTEEFDIFPSSYDGCWVHNPRTLATYHVTDWECDCKDWKHRCGPAGERCKHQIAVDAWMDGRGAEVEALDLGCVPVDAPELDPEWVVGDCPCCGGPMVEITRRVGGRGDVLYTACWRGLEDPEPGACYIRPSNSLRASR